ncbi:MAG TPA: hypothetical protein GXX60_01535 [Anaerolineaceae bacterium]|nr:hypothetical protein [Anaerolineaceae bacterium]
MNEKEKKRYLNVSLMLAFCYIFICINGCELSPGNNARETRTSLCQTREAILTNTSEPEETRPPSETPWPEYEPRRTITYESTEESIFVIDFNELGKRENGVFDSGSIAGKYHEVFGIDNKTRARNVFGAYLGVDNSNEPTPTVQSQIPLTNEDNNTLYYLRFYADAIVQNEHSESNENNLYIRPKISAYKIKAVQVYFSIHNYKGNAVCRSTFPWESVFLTSLNCEESSNTEIMHGRFGDYYSDINTRKTSQIYEKFSDLRVEKTYPESWSDGKYFVVRYSFTSFNEECQEGKVCVELFQYNNLPDLNSPDSLPGNKFTGEKECKLLISVDPVNFGVRLVRNGSIDVRIYKIIFFIDDSTN